MKVPSMGASLSDCTLRRILVNQGPTAVKAVLESHGPPGDFWRRHAETCAKCADLVSELYGGREIPVNNDPLTPELLDLLREIDG